MDLKSQIIEFMRDRPFLWNIKHPNYKDNKRREVEFEAFSKEIDRDVAEIKRVWHVLRTNFFRAHKILLEKKDEKNDSTPDAGGEKLWKYYKAMDYVLEGTNYNRFTGYNGGSAGVASSSSNGASMSITSNSNDTNNNLDGANRSRSSSCSGNLAVVCYEEDSSGASTADLHKDIRQTRSSKIFKDLRGSKVDVKHPIAQNQTNNNINAASSAIPVISTNASIKTTTSSTGINNTQSNDISRTATPRTRSSTLISSSDNNNVSMLNSGSGGGGRLSMASASSVNDVSMYSSIDIDEDYLFARSLSSTLKKFDLTTKEVIKLKFQEIIVDHLQRQQGEQQQHEQSKYQRPLDAQEQPVQHSEPSGAPNQRYKVGK